MKGWGKMRTVIKRMVVLLSAAVVGILGLAPLPAWGDTSQAAIIRADPTRSCAGDAATLTWAPPADVAGLTGYRIVHRVTTPGTLSFRSLDVGPEQTSLAFTIPFGLSTFLIYSVRSAGVEDAPFSTATLMGNRAPQAMTWDMFGGATVGDTTATVPFRWAGPVTWSSTGGLIANTLRITASPGGASVDIPISSASHSVTRTFTGLTNGVGYTFNAVTFNACGSSSSVSSPTYTPGVAPSWTRNTPPLDATRGQYVYKFEATGEPSPTYLLVNAPSWLTISSKGQVKGRPPAGTTSFSYSVVAGNRVGIEYVFNTDVVAGPFTVEIWSP